MPSSGGASLHLYINVSRIVPTARLRRTPILFPFSSFIVCTARACNNPHRLRDNALDFHASPAWTVLRGGHRSTLVGMPLTSLKVPLPSKQHSAPLRKSQSHRDLQSCRLTGRQARQLGWVGWGNQKSVCQFGSVLIQNGRPITINDTCSPNACQALNMAYINVSRIVPTARLRRTPILFPLLIIHSLHCPCL